MNIKTCLLIVIRSSQAHQEVMEKDTLLQKDSLIGCTVAPASLEGNFRFEDAVNTGYGAFFFAATKD